MDSRSLSRIVLAALVAASVPSCGGGGSPSAPTTGPSTPAQAIRTVLGSPTFTVRAGGSTFKSIDNPPVGMMDATLDWASASNPMDFYATDGRCPGFPELQAGLCTVMARVEGAAKPKRLTFNNTNSTAVYLFWVYNRGTNTDSGAIEVAVTTSGSITNPPAQGSPSPAPSASSDPRANLPAGPVTQAKVAVRTIDQGGFDYRDPQQDSAGNWIVHPGEFVVFDLSQRNGAGEKCQWLKDPVWDISDDDEILDVRGSSQPFLLRVDVLHKGYFEVTAEIDGIQGNVLSMLSVSRGE